MKPLLIVQTGHAPVEIRARHGDFAHWFRLAMRVPPKSLRIIDVEADEALPPPRMCAGALITGSAAMITDREPWSERCAGWVRDAMDVELPLIGVCYGHQLMAHALGGRVDDMPGGREVGTREIRFADGAKHPLLPTLPERMRVHETHVQAVLEAPSGSRVLAGNDHDPHQVLSYSEHALSVQFHPEFSVAVMRAYIRVRSTALRAEGLDVRALLASTAATPKARDLLRGFATRIAA